MSLGRLFFSFYWFEDYKAIKLIRRLFSSSAILIWELKKASPSNSCQQKNSASILPYFNITEKETKPKRLRKDLHRRRRKGYLAATGCAGPGELSFAPQSPSDCRRGRREGELCCRTKSSDWKCWDFEEEAFPKRFVTSVLFFGPPGGEAWWRKERKEWEWWPKSCQWCPCWPPRWSPPAWAWGWSQGASTPASPLSSVTMSLTTTVKRCWLNWR